MPALLIFSMLLTAGAVVAIVVHGGGNPCDGYAFDPAAWSELQRGDDDAGPLADKLHDCGVVRGLPRSRVRALLGAPSSHSGFRDAAGQWNYDLGHYRDDFDHSFLTLDFDDRGRVKATAVG
jgi:hypothetical protein